VLGVCADAVHGALDRPAEPQAFEHGAGRSDLGFVMPFAIGERGEDAAFGAGHQNASATSAAIGAGRG
jgi:hypothetical protein